MPSRPPKTCRHCGKHESEAGRISWRGSCASCGDRRMLEARHEIRAHSGPAFTRWRRNMAASVGGVLLDDAPREE